MRKRVAEMQQLARRTEDFTTGGYTEAFTGDVISHSYALSKEGFREEVPKRITDGDFGFCRTQKRTLPPRKGSINGDQYGALALAALKTIGTHAKDGAYNKTTLNAFYAKEQELKQLLKADPKNNGAKHYLDIMAKVKHAEVTQTTIPPQDVSIKVDVSKLNTNPQTKYISLTDHVKKYMAANGGDYNLISEWCVAQKEDSWRPKAVERKVLQLASRGLNWQPPPETPGVWYGDKGQRWDEFDKARGFYEKHPQQLRRDLQSVAQYKAAVQLLLENAEFEGNDPKTRTTILFRTEAKDVVGNVKPGETCKNGIGPAESFSVFRTVCVFSADRGTIARVPWSRINASYFMERTPGLRDDLFAGDHENEFNVDAVGLGRVYVGTVTMNEQVKSFTHFLR